jgi:hypothetical protein
MLAEHGELMLVVLTNKNPRWVPDGGPSEEFPLEFHGECSPSQLSLWSMEPQRED